MVNLNNWKWSYVYSKYTLIIQKLLLFKKIIWLFVPWEKKMPYGKKEEIEQSGSLHLSLHFSFYSCFSLCNCKIHTSSREGSDHTAWMCRPIWLFAVKMIVGILTQGLAYLVFELLNIKGFCWSLLSLGYSEMLREIVTLWMNFIFFFFSESHYFITQSFW